ncbi:ATP-grasp domain-containing protein [Paenibacillus apiarius]|uniref:ATP-grasp domain-containing protein n=1 Tax=Paenibacillus apiarius TaxID=46240 RepID=A0ABT4DML4_9BACL|nr:ATP-grasp domain-containing protein [Paenibacillus apiarius]MCY9514612.1 ATP-grasp domain-containing protein [Paenibacillus apiarius]MCY9518602.1 ATP-grasp domain-containing protein [Paenibacillus apiarius]MCY9552690.1 ATP-grasp domain-containing protein [Paenibacillus apiarius]MCY9556982.1 ATP-grasp domain-containing protein [Paenibacillus apiarius]MCY9686065.1 ATP-grasp domain-containing protein [Paenibacillus apiarius]
MRIIYCSDPLDSNRVDSDYKTEYEAARKLGLSAGLISLEHLFADEPEQAIRKVQSASEAEAAIYRGWMIKPHYYAMLYDALKSKGITLINTPEQYRHCHHFPCSYDIIRENTPASIWFSEEQVRDNFDSVLEGLQVFGERPVIVKDYVKSRKHEWEDACYISDAADKEHARQVISNFVTRQGDDLNEGIVLREFVRLEFLNRHPRSDMPLSKEYRVFFLDQQPLMMLHYWDEAEYDEERPNMEHFMDIARRVKSRFFTMDIAKLESGDWIIVELGDGQVSGLPDLADIEGFYRSFAHPNDTMLGKEMD